MGIEKYLDLNISHVTTGDIKLLEAGEGASLPFTVYPTKEYGWFIHVAWGNEEDMAERWPFVRVAGFSEAFQALLLAAQNAGCAFLRLDTDGPDSDEFPIVHEECL
ncbi:MAG: hypothetical protein KKB70_05830 [Proteobacteria bacterium]|nr:hypothetical protein [Pseudomonadota bacterium]MBU1610246.1 hypothetical protein [Pseudomonadota bacterium]